MRPGPGGGAQCALHVGLAANFVCARCGNFMCASCAVNGTEQQCPTCRALNPIGFPYDGNADLATLWGHATSSFQREAAMCVVAALIFLAFLIAGGLVTNIIVKVIQSAVGVEIDPLNPLNNVRAFAINMGLTQVVSQIVNLVVQGLAVVGFYRLLMDVLVGKRADVARMFSQVHLLPNYVLMHLIIIIIITLPTLIFSALAGVVGFKLLGLQWNRLSDFNPEQLLNPAFLALLIGSMVILMVISVISLPVILFATPELMVGQCDPVEALKRAWALGEGQRLRVFGYSLVAFGVYLVGASCCGIGLLVSLPVAMMLMLSLYLGLRRSSSLPAASHS